MEWLPDTGVELQRRLTENKNRLADYERDLILQNEELISSDPVNASKDTSFIKNVATLYFMFLIREKMKAENENFDMAAQEVFDDHFGYGHLGKERMFQEALQAYLEICQVAYDQPAPRPPRSQLT